MFFHRVKKNYIDRIHFRNDLFSKKDIVKTYVELISIELYFRKAKFFNNRYIMVLKELLTAVMQYLKPVSLPLNLHKICSFLFGDFEQGFC